MKTYLANLPEITLKYKKGDIKRIKLTSSKDTYECLKMIYDADLMDYRESFIVLFLNRANNTIGWFKVSEGGLSGTVADPKMIFGTALKAGASSIILSHNHPSENTSPSQADKNLTEKMKQAGKFLDLPILDHVIITSSGYYSFADEGLI